MRLHASLLFMPLSAIYLIAGCQETPTVSKWEVVVEKMEKKVGECDEAGDGCALVRFVYPRFTGDQPDLVARVNDTVQWTLIRLITSVNPTDQQTPTLESATQQFLNDYEEFRADVPDYELGWSIEASGQVLTLNEKVLSVEFDSYSFTGGAHPNAFTILHNFELSTGKHLSLSDLVTDLDQFSAMAEAAFKKERELPPDANLQEEGFFWDGPFVLPANFGITREGIRLSYNPYEVAPYVLGPTEFTLSYQELGLLLRRDLLF